MEKLIFLRKMGEREHRICSNYGHLWSNTVYKLKLQNKKKVFHNNRLVNIYDFKAIHKFWHCKKFEEWMSKIQMFYTGTDLHFLNKFHGYS